MGCDLGGKPVAVTDVVKSLRKEKLCLPVLNSSSQFQLSQRGSNSVGNKNKWPSWPPLTDSGSALESCVATEQSSLVGTCLLSSVQVCTNKIFYKEHEI